MRHACVHVFIKNRAAKTERSTIMLRDLCLTMSWVWRRLLKEVILRTWLFRRSAMCVFMFQKVESKHKVFQAGSYSALEQTRKLAQIIFSGEARRAQVTAWNWRLFYGKTYCLPLKVMLVANCHPAQLNEVCLNAHWNFSLAKIKLEKEKLTYYPAITLDF